MLRLVGFFCLVFLLLSILREVPVIGAVLRVPFLGFWVTAILLSAVLSKLAVKGIDRRRFQSLKRSLGATDTPYNQGKLGLLLLAQGKGRKAVPHLERAVEGEPDAAEWRYRLGCALLETGQAERAVEELRRAAELEEEHAYGAVQLRLAEALTRAGRAEEALAVLDVFERNHGEKPESLYRRGSALKRMGRSNEAREVFRGVREAFANMVAYQRKDQRRWVWMAFLRSFA